MSMSRKPPYVQRIKDKHGERLYFRRKGCQYVRLPSMEDPTFWQAYAEARQKREITSPTAPPGSFNALFNAFFASPEFKGLAPHTQRTYRSNVAHFLARHGTWPYKGFSVKALRKYLDEIGDKKGAARNFLKRIKQVLAFAVERELLKVNIAAPVKLRQTRTDGFPDWTEDDIAKFEKHWPVGTKERLAFALLLYTGQRRSDVVRMGRQHVSGGRISVKQTKGGRQLTIPLHDALKAIIAPCDGMTFLMTEYGRPFSVAGFGNWFARACTDAGVNKRAHGLRKAAARRMAEAGCTAYEIIAVTGHSSAKEAEPYTRAADQAKLAEAAMRKVRGTKTVTGRRNG